MGNTLLICGGIFHLGFAVFHMLFWKKFNWQKELASLNHVNRGVMQILNLCLTLVFIILGFISIFFSQELISTNLGRALLFSISIFWLARLIEQFIFFGIKNTFSIILSVLFFLGAIIYFIPGALLLLF